MTAFVVTNAGLAAAVSAAEMGIKVVLSSFKIGSAFGYTPVMTDTALHGSLLYEDQITSYRLAADGSLVATCALAVDAGPFDFGEIGIYTDGGMLFALAALEEPLTKFTSLGSNIASTYSFDAYLRLGQSTTVIEIDSVTAVTYSQVIGALGFTPYDAANPSGYLTSTTVISALATANLRVQSLGVGTPASGVVGSITAVGNIHTTGNVLGFQVSDIQFKENLERLVSPLTTLRRITGYTFDWKDSYIEEQGGQSPWQLKHDVGFVAQEIEAAFPIAAYRKLDGTLALHPTKIMPLVVESVKALDDEQTRLRNRVQYMENQISEMVSQLCKKHNILLDLNLGD